MDASRFDALARSLIQGASRRGLLRGLGAAALSAVVLRRPWSAAAKKKPKKKLKKNAFGCVDVGKACRGKDSVCCSGICQGKKPKKGKKDKSRCVAHDVLDCAPGADNCGGVPFNCGPQLNGVCLQTTGKASFCADPSLECLACKKDTDCVASEGPGAACVVCLTGGCEETGVRCAAAHN
jgi:hypothetical protein